MQKYLKSIWKQRSHRHGLSQLNGFRSSVCLLTKAKRENNTACCSTFNLHFLAYCDDFICLENVNDLTHCMTITGTSVNLQVTLTIHANWIWTSVSLESINYLRCYSYRLLFSKVPFQDALDLVRTTFSYYSIFGIWYRP